jgi:hypothetical protein
MQYMTVFRAAIFSSFLLSMASCRCDDTFHCPAFDASTVPYALPAEGDSFSFRNSAGLRIAVINNAAPFLSPTYRASTKQNLFGGCNVEPCDARASFEAKSTTFRNGSNVLSLQYMISSDARSTTWRKINSGGAVFDYRFAMDETSLVDESDDTTLYALMVGTRSYDTVLVKQRDTVGISPDSLAIWRVFIHRPEGVVGFEDRQTGSLFYRE